MAEYLIANGADVNAKNKNGKTPLHWAAVHDLGDEADYTGVAECLIEHGADVNAKDEVGRTPLHISKEFGKKDVSELLMRYGGTDE
jgi:ankyrin repeat protein